MKKSLFLPLAAASVFLLYSCTWQTPPNGEPASTWSLYETWSIITTWSEANWVLNTTWSSDATWWLLGTWVSSGTWNASWTGQPGTWAQNVNPNSKTYTIKITSAWFDPFKLTIKAWDKVEFVNADSAPHWPASGPHPLHTAYPGSWIEKCWTPEEPNIFDACRALAQNEIYSFVFNQKWSWWFHDHWNRELTWTIIVE
ncbi:MAG: hypothetical protein ACD_2C00228G0005 [uncultured bacterium (gcode 4)]|uniref:Uncharacterized protein n=1 Tax=uncultured bacterium (gcode 4) TaxID=1234023 RepID=K2G476_9BACT|nr:MAG: hypothetical protein ACD_2C00228G0005 [uncultured bacterium (gcode 4)]